MAFRTHYWHIPPFPPSFYIKITFNLPAFLGRLRISLGRFSPNSPCGFSDPIPLTELRKRILGSKEVGPYEIVQNSVFFIIIYCMMYGFYIFLLLYIFLGFWQINGFSSFLSFFLSFFQRYVYVYVYVYVCTSRSSWVFINLTTTIALMVGGSHTLVHVPAKCPPQLHRCLRAGDSPQF